MYHYNLFNRNCPASLQGQLLDFYAYSDEHAVELGKGYAKMLGWEHYSVYFYCDNGEEEVCLYSC